MEEDLAHRIYKSSLRSHRPLPQFFLKGLSLNKSPAQSILSQSIWNSTYCMMYLNVYLKKKQMMVHWLDAGFALLPCKNQREYERVLDQTVDSSCCIPRQDGTLLQHLGKWVNAGRKFIPQSNFSSLWIGNSPFQQSQRCCMNNWHCLECHRDNEAGETICLQLTY